MIADNLVLGAAREVRALRALGAGLGQAPSSGAGSLPSGHRAPRPVKEETPEPLEGATAKEKPNGDPGDSEEYETEESEEEEPIEKDQLAQPVVAPEVDRRPELPRRSRVPDQAGGRKDRTDPPSRSYPEKPRSRSRRRREDAKDKRKERDPDKRRDRRDPGEVDPKRSDRSAHRSGGKKKKKKRGGRKHKRLGRLEADLIVPSTDHWTKAYWKGGKGWTGVPCLETHSNGGDAETEEKVEEGKVYSVGDPAWKNFPPKEGCVVEFEGRGEDGDEESRLVWCAMLCLELRGLPTGDFLCAGRFLGAESDAARKRFGNLINRRGQVVHFCPKNPCDLDDEQVLDGIAAHSKRGRFWPADKFPAEYLLSWGSQVLKEYVETGKIQKENKRARGPFRARGSGSQRRSRERRRTRRRRKRFLLERRTQRDPKVVQSQDHGKDPKEKTRTLGW